MSKIEELDFLRMETMFALESMSAVEKGQIVAEMQEKHGWSCHEIERRFKQRNSAFSVSNSAIARWLRVYKKQETMHPALKEVESGFLQDWLDRIKEPNKGKKIKYILNNKNYFERNDIAKIVKILNGELVIADLEEAIKNRYEKQKNIIKSIKRTFLQM